VVKSHVLQVVAMAVAKRMREWRKAARLGKAQETGRVWVWDWIGSEDGTMRLIDVLFLAVDWWDSCLQDNRMGGYCRE
jgi:hypothetical protein